MPIAGFINEQPHSVARCIAAAAAFGRDWAATEAGGIVLVGSGSSRNAMTVAEPWFGRAGRGPVMVLEPLDVLDRLAQGALGRPLVVALSQSGASTTTIAAAEATRAAGLRTLLVTATPGSPLDRLGGARLTMPLGEEPVGPKTKGFTASVATLVTLAAALGGSALPAFDPSRLATAILPARAEALGLVAMLQQADVLVIAGHGAALGLALEASLKVAEMAGLAAFGLSTEELLHGRLHGMTERSLAIILTLDAGEQAEAERAAAAMRRRGCRLVARPVWQDRDLACGMVAPWNLLGAILPFQWLGVVLAEARGLRPETMRHGALSAELAIKLREEP